MKRTVIARVVFGFASLAWASAFAAPASAQDDCTCVLPEGGVGAISAINPEVFVTGSTGRQPAAAGTQLGSGSVVTTGATGTANIDLGAGCRFSMTGLMTMQIVPQQGGLCVQVIDQAPTVGGGIDGGGAAAALGLAAGAGVVVSLGFLSSVSQ